MHVVMSKDLDSVPKMRTPSLVETGVINRIGYEYPDYCVLQILLESGYDVTYNETTGEVIVKPVNVGTHIFLHEIPDERLETTDLTEKEIAKRMILSVVDDIMNLIGAVEKING